MTKKGFKSSYSELNLVTPEVYSKIMNNLSSKIDKNEMEQLNPLDDVPTESEAVLGDTSTINNDFATKLDELKDIILKNNNVNNEINPSIGASENQTSDMFTQTQNIDTVDKSVQSNIPFKSEKNLEVNNQPNTENIIPTQPTTPVASPIIPSVITPIKERKKEAKRFFCQICNQSFTRNFSKNRHINSKHGNTDSNTSNVGTEININANSNVHKRKRKAASMSNVVENLKKMKMTDSISGKRKRDSLTEDRVSIKKFKSASPFSGKRKFEEEKNDMMPKEFFKKWN